MRFIRFEDIIQRYLSGEGFVVFDTETTGLNTYHDDIIEVAGLIWEKGAEPKTFQELIKVNPNKITQGAWEVHKIPLEDIEAAREPNAVLQDFMDFTEGRCLVAHNARFDYEILNSNLIRNGLKPYQSDEVACTLAFAREQQLPGKLIDLATYYQVNMKSSNLHRALYDVQVLSDVLNKMIAENEPADMQYSLIF